MLEFDTNGGSGRIRVRIGFGPAKVRQIETAQNIKQFLEKSKSAFGEDQRNFIKKENKSIKEFLVQKKAKLFRNLRIRTKSIQRPPI